MNIFYNNIDIQLNIESNGIKEGRQLKKVRNVFIILVMTMMIILWGNKQVFGAVIDEPDDVFDTALTLLLVNYLRGDGTINETNIDQYDIDTLNRNKELYENKLNDDSFIDRVLEACQENNVQADREMVEEALQEVIDQYDRRIAEVQARDAGGIDSTIQGAQDFIDSADTTGTIDEAAVQQNVGFIYNIFFACGMVIAVVCGVCLGIKFMVGSTDGKAEVKELLLPYIIGCVIIFGAFGIWKLIINVMEIFN